jgi:hypothetical protein
MAILAETCSELFKLSFVERGVASETVNDRRKFMQTSFVLHDTKNRSNEIHCVVRKNVALFGRT